LRTALIIRFKKKTLLAADRPTSFLQLVFTTIYSRFHTIFVTLISVYLFFSSFNFKCAPLQDFEFGADWPPLIKYYYWSRSRRGSYIIHRLPDLNAQKHNEFITVSSSTLLITQIISSFPSSRRRRRRRRRSTRTSVPQL